MAFGITPRHIQEITFETLTHEQILVIGLEAAKALRWNIGYTSESGFIAYTKFSWSSWSEEVTVKIENQKVSIKSECTGSQLADWGKNKQNVETFLKTFNESIDTVSAEDCVSRFQELTTKSETKE